MTDPGTTSGDVLGLSTAVGGQVLGISTLPYTGSFHYYHILSILASILGSAVVLSFFSTRLIKKLVK